MSYVIKALEKVKMVSSDSPLFPTLPVKTFINPSRDELRSLSGKLKGNIMRHTIDHSGNHYVWDGYDAEHHVMGRALGLSGHVSYEGSLSPEEAAKSNYKIRDVPRRKGTQTT
jgi:hypothetical protein